MRTLLFFFLGLSWLLFPSCEQLTGREVARVTVDSLVTGEPITWKATNVSLKKGEKLWFWADMGMEYEGDSQLKYLMQIIRNPDTLGFVSLDPDKHKMTIGGTEFSSGGKTQKSYSGKLDFYEVPETGEYTFRVALTSNGNPTLKLMKSDLVLKL
jgi:hypothetical protein